MKQIQRFFWREIPFLFSVPAVMWQVCFLIAPMLIIFYFSIVNFSNSWFPITLYSYYQLLRFSIFTIIARSLFFALITAITCFFIAYPVCYYLAFRAARLKNILLFFLTLPFWVNFLVQVYAWYFLLEYNGLVNSFLLWIGLIKEPLLIANSLFAIYLVMVYCYLPFMIMPLYSILEKFDKRLLEASADLGATPWQTFRRITLPLSLPGIKTGLLLVLIPAFGEFVIPSLLGGSRYMFVGSLISYYFLVERNNNQGAAFTCLSALLLFAIIIIFYGSRHLLHLATWRRKRV